MQVVDHRSSDYAYPIVADPNYSGDCGVVTCTIRFNRAWTRNVRDGAGLSGIAAGVAAAFYLPVTPLAALLAAHAIFAGRYYENGNCYGFRYSPITGTFGIPVQVTHGTHNCA